MKIIEEFEQEFRRFTGAKYAIACCNGTAALHTALLAVGVKEDDEVITTPFSFIASSNAILYCRAKPVFIDILPTTYVMDARHLEITIGQKKNIKAILPVHLFGKACDMHHVMEVAERHHLRVVEDCAQALGTKIENRHVGTFGDFGTFSFYTSKNLWTFEGGMLITNSAKLEQTARMLIDHGRKPGTKNEHVMLGYNYRMNPFSALMGISHLTRHRKALQAELGSYGVEQGYYPYVIYDQPLYRKLGIKGNCPIAEKVVEQARRCSK